AFRAYRGAVSPAPELAGVSLPSPARDSTCGGAKPGLAKKLFEREPIGRSAPFLRLTFPHRLSSLARPSYLGSPRRISRVFMELSASEVWSQILEEAQTALPEHAFRT